MRGRAVGLPFVSGNKKRVMRLIMGLCLGLFFLLSCGPSQKAIFAKRSPHEKYGDGIAEAGLGSTQLGAMWIAAAAKGLNQPLAITLPYKETGYFPANEPRAAGYVFSAKQGERLVVNVSKTPASDVLLFVELWMPGDESAKMRLLETADTLTHRLEYEIEKAGRYLLRIQPELLRSVEYTLTLTTAPSLAFPVRESDKPAVISLWGVDRDAGARRHEGIDIQAKFRTPVVASADGFINSVTENNLGGKVIFLRPSGKRYSLYYAHLDSQLVRPGQTVKEGDILGLVGNTGNAKFTVPHLHFGIYTLNGAVDPYPFVATKRPAPKDITVSLERFDDFMRVESAASIYAEPSTNKSAVSKVSKGAVVRILAATDSWYKVRLPDNAEGFIPARLLTRADGYQKVTLKNVKRLLDAPDSTAAARTTLDAGSVVNVAGVYNNYYLVNHDNNYGWVQK
jgi:peptidoglycan LD-endopeptidase LytH